MSADPAPYVPSPRRPLSAEEKGRVLEKLRRLETAAMFTEHWTAELSTDLFRWTCAARAGHVECAEVPRMAEAFERLGVE